MEAIETYCAENIRRPLLYASTTEMQCGHRLICLEVLPRPRSSLYDEHRRILWIEGRGLRDDAEYWVPFEAVHADFSLPPPPGSGCFVNSTNGLASGNDRSEAILHGLHEVIERDAAALFLGDETTYERTKIDLSTIDDKDCEVVLDRLKASRIAVAVWDVTSDIGIAAFRCHLMELDDGPGLLPLPAEGFGCHTDRGIALAQALLEAAQARVTLITGARDDIAPSMHDSWYDREMLAGWRNLVATPGRRSFQDVVSSPLAFTLDVQIEVTLSRLEAAGLREAVCVDLTPPSAECFAVIRIVVPGLEGPPEAGCVAGSRLRARLGGAR
jgi:ribosomal protein S12 methylthiotransferase accessory factor